MKTKENMEQMVERIAAEAAKAVNAGAMDVAEEVAKRTDPSPAVRDYAAANGIDLDAKTATEAFR